jgi:hypothetical protein
MPEKPASIAPVPIEPLVGESRPSSSSSAAPTGIASRKPRRRAGPGADGPIANSGPARSARAAPEALNSDDLERAASLRQL